MSVRLSDSLSTTWDESNSGGVAGVPLPPGCSVMDRHLGGLRAGGLIAELRGKRIREGERNLDLMFLRTQPIKPRLRSRNGAATLAVRTGWSELNRVVLPQPKTWFCLLA